VNIGLAKKLGQPNYGSAGASCNLEFELDSGQMLQDPDGFQRHLRHAYDACRLAIQDELNRQLRPPEVCEPKVIEEQEPPPLQDHQQKEVATESTSEPTLESTAPATTPPATPRVTTTPATLGVVQTKPRASQRQLNYVHHLAHGITGLTPHRLEILSATVCGKRLAHLTSADASLLIETLKDIQAGDKDLCGASQEACA